MRGEGVELGGARGGVLVVRLRQDRAIDSTLDNAAAFCDEDSAATYCRCADGTTRFWHSWGAGENDTTLVYLEASGELVYGDAYGYDDTPCGSDTASITAGREPEPANCLTCTLCDYGEGIGAGGAAGAGSSDPIHCSWRDDGRPVFPE